MASAVHRLGAHALLRSFAAGRVSVVQTTRHFLDRIDRCNRELKFERKVFSILGAVALVAITSYLLFF